MKRLCEDPGTPSELRAELLRSRAAGQDYAALAKLPQLKAALSDAAREPLAAHSAQAAGAGKLATVWYALPVLWKVVMIAAVAGAVAVLGTRPALRRVAPPSATGAPGAPGAVPSAHAAPAAQPIDPSAAATPAAMVAPSAAPAARPEAESEEASQALADASRRAFEAATARPDVESSEAFRARAGTSRRALEARDTPRRVLEAPAARPDVESSEASRARAGTSRRTLAGASRRALEAPAARPDAEASGPLADTSRRALETSETAAPADASPPAASSRPAPGASSSRREIAQLLRIRALLEHNPAAAYRLARRSELEFPRGVLSEERQALAVLALAKSGAHAEAERKAREFFARYPQSPLRELVDEALQR